MNVVRSWIQRAVRAAGLDLHRLRPETSPPYQLRLGLRRFGVDLVLDVGANIGQFGAELRAFGFEGDIVSFEPLSHAHALLSARAEADGRWHVHPRSAIGDLDGEIEINIAGNSFSSSILPMLAAHSEVADSSAYVGKEKVPIASLDTAAPPYLANARNPFLKIDTQGFEAHVLDGAARILPSIRGVLCELSLVPLYEGQTLWREMIARFEAAGFTLWTLQPAFADRRDGRTLQVDVVFFRLPSAAE
jgi:FkbM family methyltransferase